MNDASFDSTYAAEYGIVCGTDEAGRGPLAGPVVAAAVVLPEGLVIEGLDDSKKLTEKKREKLYDEIIEKAAAFGIAQATQEEIDEMNILAASLTAMRRAVMSKLYLAIAEAGHHVFHAVSDRFKLVISVYAENGEVDSKIFTYKLGRMAVVAARAAGVRAHAFVA